MIVGYVNESVTAKGRKIDPLDSITIEEAEKAKGLTAYTKGYRGGKEVVLVVKN